MDLNEFYQKVAEFMLIIRQLRQSTWLHNRENEENTVGCSFPIRLPGICLKILSKYNANCRLNGVDKNSKERHKSRRMERNRESSSGKEDIWIRI